MITANAGCERRPTRVHRVPASPLAPDLVDHPHERKNDELKHRSDVVGVFLNPYALRRLAGSSRIEQQDELGRVRPMLLLRALHGPAHRTTTIGQEGPGDATRTQNAMMTSLTRVREPKSHHSEGRNHTI